MIDGTLYKVAFGGRSCLRLQTARLGRQMALEKGDVFLQGESEKSRDLDTRPGAIGFVRP
jgi:hypothetical protein